MILVTGATGQFGANAIDHLLKKGIDPARIAVLVRDASKAKVLEDKGVEVRVGDYTDYNSLLLAFQGIEKLLLVSSNDRQAIENRTSQHTNAIKAAKEARVKHIIYTSFVRKALYEDSAIAAFQDSHVKTELYLKNSGINFTILQNGMYLEMIPVFAGEKVVETGTILFPAGDGKASFVLREDLAEAAAHILTTAGHENKVYLLTNSTATSFYDLAAELSQTLRKNITYQSPAVEAFESILKGKGVPEVYIGTFTMWATALSQGMMDIQDETLEKFLGRKPTTIKEFLTKVYG